MAPPGGDLAAAQTLAVTWRLLLLLLLLLLLRRSHAVRERHGLNTYVRT